MTTTVWDKNSPLHEIFSLPISSRPVANIGGQKLYSSPSLPSKYTQAMKEQGRTKAISKDIDKLVNNGKIVPCWLSKGVYRLIKHKVFGESERHIMGFYAPEHHKIFLLMDNNITFGFASNQQLANLTLHEGMHMAAASMKNGFLTLFRSELTSYYSEMYKEMFAIEKAIDTKEIQAIYTFLFTKFEQSKSGSVLNFIKKYFEKLRDTFSKYVENKSEFEQKLRDMITFMTIYLKGDVGSLISSIPQYRHIVMPMYNAYSKGLGAKRVNSICIQELMIPSEVLCIYSEFTKNLSKVHSAFKKIK